MDLNNAKVFFYVAKFKSFTRAAGEVWITQSAVSTRVKKLEDELNIKLFLREKNKVILTDAGKELYSILSKFFTELEEIESSLILKKDNTDSHLNIGLNLTTSEKFITDIMLNNSEKFTFLNYDITSNHLISLREKLVNGDTDVAIISDMVVWKKDFYFLREILDFEYVLISNKEIDIYDNLEDYNLILTGFSMKPLNFLINFISKILQEENFRPKKIQRLNVNVDLALKFVKNTKSYSILTKSSLPVGYEKDYNVHSRTYASKLVAIYLKDSNKTKLINKYLDKIIEFK